MDARMEELWDEYDELTAAVEASGYELFAHNLKRWFAFLDSTAPIAGVVLRLENSATFKPWYEDCQKTAGSWAGSGRLQWPDDATQELSLRINLFRAFANSTIEPQDFCACFLYTDGNFDTHVSNINVQLFTPTARQLRRYVRRRIDLEAQLAPVVPNSLLEQLIPATDRLVSLDHNSQTYQETIEALDTAEQAVIAANNYDDATDKEQRIAELSATRRLLQSTRVRVGAVTAVAGPVLIWLAEKFAGGLVGQLASSAWRLISTLIGI